jgi:phenylacetate-CoA ligase
MQKLVKKLPYPVKQGLKYVYGAIPFSIRYGKAFRETYKFLQESQGWSKSKLEDYQMHQLEKLLNYTYKNVSYYRRIFDERGLKPGYIQTLNDLKQLPYLTKDNLKNNFEDFIAKNVNVSCLKKVSTSGTSGKPLQFYWDINEIQKEWAFTCHHWSCVGYKPGDTLIQLRGTVIDSDKPVNYDPVMRVLRLSPRIDNKRIVAVFFASETIYPWQRQVTEELFGCRVFGFYGMAEHVVTARECENSTNYHCVPQYGITEISPSSNEIIGTGFLNYANPFIRYKTTDIASQINSTGCSECGREYNPVFKAIEGRIEDFIINPEGVPVSPAVITHPFKTLETIMHTQIIQTEPDKLLLKIVPWNLAITKEYENEVKQLCHGLQKIVGTAMHIKTENVNSIKTTKSGKFKWIISDVSRDFLKRGTGKL